MPISSSTYTFVVNLDCKSRNYSLRKFNYCHDFLANMTERIPSEIWTNSIFSTPKFIDNFNHFHYVESFLRNVMIICSPSKCFIVHCEPDRLRDSCPAHCVQTISIYPTICMWCLPTGYINKTQNVCIQFQLWNKNGVQYLTLWIYFIYTCFFIRTLNKNTSKRFIKISFTFFRFSVCIFIFILCKRESNRWLDSIPHSHHNVNNRLFGFQC